MDFSAPSTSKKPKPERGPVLRHGATPLEAQRHALQKLLKDPSKPVHIPEPPPEGVKTLRDPRDMMKNVQGSSAGAGESVWWREHGEALTSLCRIGRVSCVQAGSAEGVRAAKADGRGGGLRESPSWSNAGGGGVVMEPGGWDG